MWQKIKCWLGWHEYEDFTVTIPAGEYFILLKSVRKRCKHCGKVKR